MIRIMVFVCLGVCLASSALVRLQESKPNFSGRWVLNPSLTKPRVPPGFDNKRNLVCCETKSAVVSIDHKEPNVTITTSMVRVDNHRQETVNHFVTDLTTNGGETVIQTDGIEFHTTAHWESGKLITYTVSNQKGFIPSVEVRSLSANGKTMTIESYSRRIEGEPALTMVFERTDK